MSIDDLLFVASRAERDGRRSLREAMLTLAIGQSAPGDAWAERCRARLLAERPGHFLGVRASLTDALADPRVTAALARLAAQHPAARVSWLRFRAEVEEGSYTGESPTREAIVESILGPPAEAEVRRDPAEHPRGPLAAALSAARHPALARAHAAGQGENKASPAVAGLTHEPVAAPRSQLEIDVASGDPSVDQENAGDDELAGLYMAVLLAIALLLSAVGREGRLAA